MNSRGSWMFLALGAWGVCSGASFAQEPAAPAPVVVENAAAPADEAPAVAESREPEFRELAEQTQRLVSSMAVVQEITQDAKAPEAGLQLTLDECVDMALGNNPQIRIAEDAVDIAESQVGQTRAGLKPQIAAGTAYTRTDFNTRSGGFPMNLLSGLTQSSEEFRSDQFGVDQVLYAGGQLRAAVRASKYLAESETWRREATIDDIVFQTREAYYGVILAQALVRVAEDSVLAFERHVQDTTNMFDVGMISQFEVLRAQTELSARKTDLIRTQNAVKLAEAALLRLLNLPQETDVQLENTFPPIVADVDLTALTGQALDLRPEMRALKSGIGAAEENVTRTKGQFKPQVAASVNWKNTHKGGSLQPDGWTYTVGAQWDLYTGGRRKYEVVEARANVSSLKHQLENVDSLVRLDVKQAYVSLYNAMSQIVSEYDTVQQAREGLRLANLRFTEGVGTQVEELDAELALTNAQVALARAFNNYAVARAALERAVGASWQERAPEVAAEDGN